MSTGGGPASGGAPSAGGTSTGGTNTGGANTGGNVGTGGASTGGAGTSGTSTGGASTGGASTGGASTGGASSGGSDTGGSNTGGDIGMGGDPGTGGASPVNLHPNGTFETNTNGWFSWNGTVSQTTTRAHGGSASGLLSGRAGSGPMATDLFNPGSANSVVAPGHTYTVTFWVTIANAASADVNLTRKFGCNKTPGVPADGTNDSYSWLVSPKAVADGEWVEFTSTLTVPDAATCDLADVLVYVEGPAVTVDLYVDDVAIYEN